MKKSIKKIFNKYYPHSVLQMKFKKPSKRSIAEICGLDQKAFEKKLNKYNKRKYGETKHLCKESK